MNPDEIKAKAAALAELYAAKAAGKMLQINYGDVWKDCLITSGPRMSSDFSRWRVKPEPRRMWTTENQDHGATQNEQLVAEWRRRGIAVTEWQEVLS